MTLKFLKTYETFQAQMTNMLKHFEHGLPNVLLKSKKRKFAKFEI